MSKFTGTGRVVDKDAKPERGRRRKSLEIPQQPCGQSCWSHFAAHILALLLPQLIYCSDRGFIYSSYPSVLSFIMHTESKIWISEDWSLMRNISAKRWLFLEQHQEQSTSFRSLSSCSGCFATSLLMSPGVQCLVPLSSHNFLAISPPTLCQCHPDNYFSAPVSWPWCQSCFGPIWPNSLSHVQHL